MWKVSYANYSHKVRLAMEKAVLDFEGVQHILEGDEEDATVMRTNSALGSKGSGSAVTNAQRPGANPSSNQPEQARTLSRVASVPETIRRVASVTINPTSIVNATPEVQEL